MMIIWGRNVLILIFTKRKKNEKGYKCVVLYSYVVLILAGSLLCEEDMKY